MGEVKQILIGELLDLLSLFLLAFELLDTNLVGLTFDGSIPG